MDRLAVARSANRLLRFYIKVAAAQKGRADRAEMLLRDARSRHLPGSVEATAWEMRRDALLGEARTPSGLTEAQERELQAMWNRSAGGLG